MCDAVDIQRISFHKRKPVINFFLQKFHTALICRNLPPCSICTTWRKSEFLFLRSASTISWSTTRKIRSKSSISAVWLSL